MKINKILSIFIAVSILSCSGTDDDPVIIVGGPSNGGTDGTGGGTNSLTYTPTETLKGSASFPIGMIASASKLNSNSEFKTVINKEFNSLTAENDMKMANMFTGPNTYDFSDGDVIVNYAKNNGMRVFGHALVWHSSIPNWLQNYAGTDIEFEAQVEGYIKATVSHFSQIKNSSGVSVVEGWDVVNEAFTTEASGAVFRNRIGKDYLEKCFKWAREADSNVKLFYNDYNLESQNSKSQQVVDMVNTFITNNIPIDGIGFQMHINYLQPDLSTIGSNLTALVNTGLLIHFSEIDMTVNKDKTLSELTIERAQEQQARYKAIVSLYNTIPTAQKFGITLWGLRDNDSWLLNFLDNQNEWPLLFNSDYEYKLAHKGFIEGLQQ